jgi:hypothetical protein
MLTSTQTRRSPWADVWCRRCCRASRVAQWIATADSCPYCGAPPTERRAWVLLRIGNPKWPLQPVIGMVYDRLDMPHT